MSETENDKWLRKREEVQSFIDIVFSEKGDRFIEEWRSLKRKYDQREDVLDSVRGETHLQGDMCRR